MPPGPHPDAFSVFICYAHEDNDSADPSKRWLDRLLQHLQPLVVQNQIRAWSDKQLQAGDFWNAEIQSQLQQARVALLLVSQAFLASDYIRNIELPVLLMNARQRSMVILPIILSHSLINETSFRYPDPVNGPQELTLASLQAANSPTEPLDALPEHAQGKVLVAVAQRVLALVQSAGRTSTLASGAIHNLPFERNRYFTGREEALQALHDALNGKGAAALTAISGMGGIGKSQTALEYAYRYAEDYRAIFWVKADSHSALTSSFIELATLLALPEKDEQESEKAVRAVMSWLEHYADWLLIFDNADAPELLKPFRPRNAAGHVLLTSRAQLFDQLGISAPVELQTMSADEAVEFLFTRTGRKADNAAENTAAAELADELGYLPLALEQAGAYILAKKARFQAYLISYRKQRLALLQQANPVAGEYPASVATTWTLNFGEVEKASEAAADLLKASAFLSPDRIPFELISTGRKQLGPAIEAALAGVEDDPLLMNQLLAPLTLYSLVRVDVDQQTYSIHRLVQEVVQSKMDEPSRRLWAERVVEALNEAFPSTDFRNWPTCERLVPHAKQAARLVKQWQIASHSAARLLNQAGVYSNERGQYKDTEALFKQALAIFQQVLGPDHPYVAISLNNLGRLYREQGKFDDAESLYKQAIAIDEKAFGPDHPDLAVDLNNLARLYYQQGKFAAAEPLFQQALKIKQQALRPDHPSLATSLNNLAALYRVQGKLAAAEPLYNQALAIRQQTLEPDHPEVAQSLNNLALLYQDQGKLDDAERLFKQACNIVENALGPQHPNVATCLENYAILLRKMHHEAEAAEMEARARAIRQAE
ncbi:MAG TPA: FxSxx-COOH system tetratricopeptide repeat protein [Blastocatellia bacterium]|nr:FxSxx-COOH system tetratricopeptide repeat protein [Blastocatellia bacterium]